MFLFLNYSYILHWVDLHQNLLRCGFNTLGSWSFDQCSLNVVCNTVNCIIRYALDRWRLSLNPLIFLAECSVVLHLLLGWRDYIIHLATGNWLNNGNTRGPKPVNFETILIFYHFVHLGMILKQVCAREILLLMKLSSTTVSLCIICHHFNVTEQENTFKYNDSKSLGTF